MNQPAEGKSGYELSVRSDTDRITPEMSAYMSVIQVHSATRRVVMFLNRPGGDLAARPIGIFGDALPAPKIAAIKDAIDQIKWAELPRPVGGDVNAAVISIDFSQGARIIQRSFSARNAAFIQALSPLMSQIDELGPALLAKPLRAIDLAVERTGTGFKLVIRNIGTGPIVFADVRLPGTGQTPTRGQVSVAEKAEGLSGTFAVPPTFHPIPLQPLGTSPAVVTLKAGQTYEVETQPWSAPKAATYFARASWEDYVGPQVDPNSTMPLIPSPEQMLDPRPYSIRGAVFSKALKIVGDRPRR